MTSLLKYQFMRLCCDFMMDWYFFRHMNKDMKDKKMAMVNAVREKIVDHEKVEAHEHGV